MSKTSKSEKAAPEETGPAAPAESQPAAPAETQAAAPRRKAFEAASAINLGKAGVREAGDNVYADELSPEDLAQLIEAGRLRDADAPIPPSQAEGVAAFDRLARIAQKIGALKRDGAEYRIGEKTFMGLTAFRAGMSIDELEAAIVARAKA